MKRRVPFARSLSAAIRAMRYPAISDVGQALPSAHDRRAVHFAGEGASTGRNESATRLPMNVRSLNRSCYTGALDPGLILEEL